jgi:hypothetical protein
VRFGKSSKYEKNEYKLNLGCPRQKPIGALTQLGLGEMLSQINFKLFPKKLVRSGKT